VIDTLTLRKNIISLAHTIYFWFCSGSFLE